MRAYKISLLSFCTVLLTVSKAFAQKDSSLQHRTHFVVYAEVYGHNYYGFQSEKETGRLSLNVGYRHALLATKCFGMFSAGWGIFSEKHSTQIPYQPRVYFNERISFIPIDAIIQIGNKHHFVEMGFGCTLAFGNHCLYYTDSHGSGTFHTISNGVQYVPRIGYAFYAREGFVLRLSFTPHFLPKEYKSYQGLSLDQPNWIPFGLSFGWAF